jgi:FAS-associated factor 2
MHSSCLYSSSSSSNRVVTNEQDSAYEESLRIDKEKERKKQSDVELAEDEKVLEEAIAASEESLVTEQKRTLLARITSLAPEPPSTQPNIATIAFRLPPKYCSEKSKTRIERRFEASQPASALYDYVRSLEEFSTLESSGAKIEIWLSHPSKKIEEEEDGETIESHNLCPRGLVIVRVVESEN